jgi:hypothetical protein
LNQEELIKRSLELHRNKLPSSVPIINYVNKEGNLQIIKEKFNVILSCHSIEHQLNLIKHLNDIANLLETNGYYFIICPDKRYCFDHFISETSIADIIQMNMDNRKKHNIKSIIEHRALTCHNDSEKHWNGDHGDYKITSEMVKKSINEFNNSKDYIDVHSMQFTPSSFSSIISLLNELKFIQLKVVEVYHTVKNSNEFYAILQKC